MPEPVEGSDDGDDDGEDDEEEEDGEDEDPRKPVLGGSVVFAPGVSVGGGPRDYELADPDAETGEKPSGKKGEDGDEATSSRRSRRRCRRRTRPRSSRGWASSAARS